MEKFTRVRVYTRKEKVIPKTFTFVTGYFTGIVSPYCLRMTDETRDIVVGTRVVFPRTKKFPPINYILDILSKQNTTYSMLNLCVTLDKETIQDFTNEELSDVIADYKVSSDIISTILEKATVLAENTKGNYSIPEDTIT